MATIVGGFSGRSSTANTRREHKHCGIDWSDASKEVRLIDERCDEVILACDRDNAIKIRDALTVAIDALKP